MSISPLSLGDAGIAGAAALVTAYELWLFKRRRGHAEHLWLAVMSAMAAAYSVLMAAHYNVGSGPALLLSRFEGVALGTLSFACLAWILTVNGKATRSVLQLLIASWALLSALTLSPWVIQSTYAVAPFVGESVFWRRTETPGVSVLKAIGLALVFTALLLSTRAPIERRAEARHFQVGVGLWGVAAVYAAVSGALGRAPSFSTIEYGFMGLALSLVAHDVRHYMQALSASEQATEVALSKHRSLEALHRDVVASVGEGVVLLDAEQRVRLWNPTLVRLTKVSQLDALGRPLWDLLHIGADDRRTLEAGLEESAKGRTVTTVPIAIRSAGQQVYAVWTLTPFGSGAARGAIAVLHDVTAEQAARTALIRSERNSQQLIESLPDAIAVLSGDRILFINTAMSTVLGLDPEDSLGGLSASRLVHHAERERLREVRQGGAPAELRLSTRRRSVVAEVRCVDMEFDGAPAQALLARDVTEQKQLTARMMELDRMVAVGTLAAGVGHEVNNPLAYVMANLEELRDSMRDQPVDPGARAFVEEALKGSHRIRDIVQAISGFSRAGVERRTVSLSEAVQSATTMAGNEIRHRARLSVEHRGELYVAANEAELAQVFLNLLVNASQAIETGGLEDNEIRVRTYSEEGHAVCEVTDTGSGISPDVMERIFDPFFTTKPVGKGTGLGLSICRQSIRALGGDLEVESEVGVGSTFRVRLPVVDPITEPLRLVSSPSAAPTRRLRVMLVDDEASLVRALARPLRRHFDLIECTSADEALEHLERGDAVDALVTDLMMPGKSGMELYELVRERFPAVEPRMLFTTGGAFTPESTAFCAKMTGRVIAKPASVAELRRRVVALAEDAKAPGDAVAGR